MKLFTLLLTSYLLCLTSVHAQDKVFNAQTFTLENGLQGIVVPNHRAPVVTHMVWYKVGAADEPRGKSGIAHFLEHLMFKGSTYTDKNGETVTLAPGAFSHIIKSLSGQDNAFTGQDYTAYYQSVPAEHLETVMRMEAGRMRGMTLPAEEVLSERDVILEERSQRTDNNPRARFYEQMDIALYPNHPYGTPIIGWAHEMAGLIREDAFGMYHDYYAPNNAILIVSGDVTVEQVKRLANDIYGGIEKQNVPERIRTTRPPFDGTINVTMHDATVRQPLSIITAQAASARTNPDDSLALEMLAEIIGGGSSSRLYKSLVIDQKIASDAGVQYSSETFDPTEILFYAVPHGDADVDAVRKALQAEIDAVIESGVTEDELKDAITRSQNAAIYARDSLSGPAMIIGRALANGISLDNVETWPTRLNALTPADIRRVAQTYLDRDNDKAFIVTGTLLPEDDHE